MNRSSRVYVAGHQGLVGSAILRRLRAEGFSRLVTRTRADLDLTDQLAVNRFFREEKPEYVFLAAAKVGGILANSTRPAEFIRDNLLIEVNVIDAAWRSGATKLLFLGSSCIYPKLAPQPMREEHLLSGPLEQTNEWYAVAKIAGLKMSEAYRRQYGFNAIGLMPTNLYGPGDNFDLLGSHVLPALLRKFHLGKIAGEGRVRAIEIDEQIFGPIPVDLREGLSLATGTPDVRIWGTGSPRREFLFVDDLAEACLFLMENYDSGELINVGTGEDLTIRELAELTAEVVGYRGAISFDPEKPDGTPQKLLDVSRLRGLGWRARTPLREGLETTYAWYLTQSATARE